MLVVGESDSAVSELRKRIENRSAVVGVCGLGYVGLPLAAAAADAGYRVVGLDIDESKTTQLNEGVSYIGAVSSAEIKRLRSTGRFHASAEFSELSQCDVILVCVPTPLTRNREPDLSFIVDTTEAIARRLRPGQLI